MPINASDAVRNSLGTLLTAGLLGVSVHAQEYRETAVPNHQISAVVRDVAQWHDAQHPECKFERSLGSKPGTSSGGKPEEHWSIAACRGQTFTYRVSVVSQSQGGGITVVVGNLNRQPIGESAEQGKPDLAASCQEAVTQLAAMKAEPEKDPDDFMGQAQFVADSAALAGQIKACRDQGLLPDVP